jgi:predicted RNA-binding protein with PUA-like domain
MALLRISRLSVQPVTEAEWMVVLEMAQAGT